VSTASLIKPDAEIGPEFGDGDIHGSKVYTLMPR
jgi:hypothetical protein